MPSHQGNRGQATRGQTGLMKVKASDTVIQDGPKNSKQAKMIKTQFKKGKTRETPKSRYSRSRPCHTVPISFRSVL